MDNFLYRSFLGALSYLFINTLPYYRVCCGVIITLGSKSTLTTCHPITYLMQYVRETVSKGIQFSGSMFVMLIFTDSDQAGDIKDYL